MATNSARSMSSTASFSSTSRNQTLVSTPIPGVTTSGVYSLKWNAFHAHLATGLAKLFQDDEFTDVTLACDGQFVKSHKFLLSLCSPFFKRLFLAHKTDRNDNTIIILNNVPFTDLENVLSFIYNGETNVSHTDLPSFLQTGELLQIEGLSSSSSYGDKDEKHVRRDLPKNSGESQLPRKNVPGSTGTNSNTTSSETSMLQNRLLRSTDPSGRVVNKAQVMKYSANKSIIQTSSPAKHSRMTPPMPGSTSRNKTMGSEPSAVSRTVMIFKDPLEPNLSSTIIEEVEDPLNLHGPEITEVNSSESFDGRQMSMMISMNEERYHQEYTSTNTNNSVYDESNSNQDDEEECVEMETYQDQDHTNLNHDIFDDTLSGSGSSSGRHEIRGLQTFTARTHKPPERKKTSALWDYFKYDEGLDVVHCQLQKDGRSCTFSARHKPLSNMKYHIRTCHRLQYETILPRLLNRH